MKLNNTYFVLRHGEAESNARNICSSWPETFENHLTDYGKEQIVQAAEKLHSKTVDFIFCSPLTRAHETAEIVGEAVGVKPQVDERLREISFGIYNGKSIQEFHDYFKEHGERMQQKAPEGESYSEVQDRIVEFFKEINEKHASKTIVIVSHQAPLLLLIGWLQKQSLAESIEPLGNVFNEQRVAKGELIELN